MIVEKELPADIRSWLRSFKEKKRRPLRILHIGNIANNAYNNAKLLNEVGLDCDVICYSYYHIMGCPEWEDADFGGTIKDQFFPDWNLIDLGGFTRPRWFVQGPPRFCIKYLLAKRDGKKFVAQIWWRILDASRLLICSPAGLSVRKHLRKVRSRWFSGGEVISCFLSAITGLCTFFYYLLLVLAILAEKILVTVTRRFEFAQPRKKALRHFLLLRSPKKPFDERVDQHVNSFAKIFPDRTDKLLAVDLRDYRHIIPLWTDLFSRYDIIQGYSTDPILPLLAGKPYFAFEHGTLREIPFQKTAQGRTTALSYYFAEHVFVTNADCLENAYSLANGHVSFINHPYDEDHGLNREGWKELRLKLCKDLDAEFLFFFPTRHDWVSGTGYADKANDLFVHAFTRLRHEGYKVGMVCCQWGANVKESQKLLEENGCTQYVLWKKPMGTIQFERTALACHVVVDQFQLGSFGGILFKAMAVGVPVCSYLNEDKMLNQYGEVPPVINCLTEEEIVTRMKKIMAEPSILRELSTHSRDWIKKYHNSADTVRIQMEAYKQCLDPE